MIKVSSAHRSDVNESNQEAWGAADGGHVDCLDPWEAVHHDGVDGGQQRHRRPHAQHWHHQEEQHREQLTKRTNSSCIWEIDTKSYDSADSDLSGATLGLFGKIKISLFILTILLISDREIFRNINVK